MNPIELATAIDLYNAARNARLAQQKIVDGMEVIENQQKAEVIAALKSGELTAAGGKTAIAKLVIKNEPAVKDWEATYAYIHEHKYWDLLYRRVNAAAVKARWDLGVVVPGVESYPVESLSLSQIKE
jgi:hypothetical protein